MSNYIKIQLAKQGIAEVGLTEFKSAIISSKDKCIKSTKKSLSAVREHMKWFLVTDSFSISLNVFFLF